ncbi:MAG: T9SS C-terminal target domain-containing protein [Calditrichaeota bacterium]|nr:MAG: T9SS C-terminal target domain-containing protein [Calditrichota bacterium]
MNPLTTKMHTALVALSMVFMPCFVAAAMAQQIAIPRVEMMPNKPEPYQMRAWAQVAAGYDSLVFDLNQTGSYLPLIRINTNTINYPNHESVALHSYVGTNSPGGGEAINVLPAVIGATLVGIDKSNQNGMNWVLMCEEFFNRRSSENVYLNNPATKSGNDWWYDTMPNVFFYQLFDLYGGVGDFEFQFTSVADRWLEAVTQMGGITVPWMKPNMNYRAWNLSTMTPNDQGVKEPEAAGAIAWILYNAYIKTGNEKYRIGAELAMEFLNSRTTNPSYELQLPYGAYTAERMNAELGTNYNITKIINWCFDVGPLRRWGVITGNWGGFDCYGLIGEATGQGDYAFAMNGFEQVGALVPLVRYDDRFARAIGKWVLNVANASRLFYAKYHPVDHQDNEDWATEYDPNSYIAYEAMRRDWNGKIPYATGDAMRGGWAATNLALYGASHVGIFGGIIDTTNVEMILKLDVRKTDYFSEEAYPTFLYFNPYSETKSINIETGPGMHDVYDAISNSFLLTGISGSTDFQVPAEKAVLVVITPTGGNVTYDLDKMSVNDIIVDYKAGRNIANYPPRIKALSSASTQVFVGEANTVYCTAEDKNADHLTYQWSVTSGMLSTLGATAIWSATESNNTAQISCRVEDGKGGSDSSSVSVFIIDNHVPTIDSLFANPAQIGIDDSTSLTCIATDLDNDSLSYFWEAASGSIRGAGPTVTWKAPSNQGYYTISCLVKDSKGAQVLDSVAVIVGGLVGDFPFDNNANDVSGLGNNGIISGAQFVEDRFGNANSALSFDGDDDHVRIPVHPSLNFQNAISLNFWMKSTDFFSREAFVISHGSWQNRWKVSIIPDKKLRWTANTESGIFDLDTKSPLKSDTLYNVTVTYGNGSIKIYLNGHLDGDVAWNGLIMQTNFDLMIGQMLPGNTEYNFKGEIDDVKIFNYVLSPEEIKNLAEIGTAVDESFDAVLPKSTILYPGFPNPFNPSIKLRYFIAEPGHVHLKIFNSLGQMVATIMDNEENPGFKTAEWNGHDKQGQKVPSGVYFVHLVAGSDVQIKKILMLK